MGNNKNKRQSAAQRRDLVAKKAEERLRRQEEIGREQTRKEFLESKKRMCEQQAEQSIAENATTAEVDDPYGNNRVRRWRKCASVAEKLVHQVNSPSTGLTVSERKDVLRRFAEDSRIIGLLPEFLKDTKATEEKLKH